MVHRTK